MKKKRRIEITWFSRRTTIGVNGREDDDSGKRPHYQRDTSQQLVTKLPSSEEPGLNQQPSGAPQRNGGQYGR